MPPKREVPTHGQAQPCACRSAKKALRAGSKFLRLCSRIRSKCLNGRLDGVIELQVADLQIELGNDINRPDKVTVQYRVCLYAANGTEVRCWAANAAIDYQRCPFECLGLAVCLKLMVEVAARQAIAQIMVEAEKDPVLAA